MAIWRACVAFGASLVGLVLVVPIGVAWLIFEAIACGTTRAARFFEAQVVSANDLVEFSPIIGWRPRTNLNVYYLTMVQDAVCHTVTDAHGWPDQIDLAVSQVVVFGDSYAFGYGVDSKATFWRQNHGLVVKAIGAPGYNMVQEVLLMRELSDRLKGKLIVWFIYFGNDLYDNLRPNNRHYRTPFVCKPYAAEHWHVATEHVSQAPWPSDEEPHYYERLAEICSVTPLADRAYSACEFLISQGLEICTKAGARLVIMTVPDVVQLSDAGRKQLTQFSPNKESLDADMPDKKIREMGVRLGVPVIALKDRLTLADYKERDPHWNERGHRQVAGVIRQVWSDISTQSDAALRKVPTRDGLLPAKVTNSL